MFQRGVVGQSNSIMRGKRRWLGWGKQVGAPIAQNCSTTDGVTKLRPALATARACQSALAGQDHLRLKKVVTTRSLALIA